MKAIFYKRPNGQQEVLEVTNILANDEEYLVSNGVNVSMEEDIDGWPIVYLDDGETLEDGTPNEIIILAGSRTCEEVMSEGVEKLKQRKLRKTNNN